MSPYGVTMPQWIKYFSLLCIVISWIYHTVVLKSLDIVRIVSLDIGALVFYPGLCLRYSIDDRIVL